MNKLHIGILSTASIVARFVNAVRVSKDFEVSAIASRSIEKALKKAGECGIKKTYGSYDELIDDPTLDAVYIATINSEHYKWAKKALNAGKHVLCEKPCTLKAADANDLFLTAEENGLFFMEMEKVVFLPVVQEIKRRIQKGDFGRITMADFSSSFDPGYNSWFFDLKKGGGPLYGNAIYSIQLMQYLLDYYADDACGLCTSNEDQAENQFAAVIKMENGVLFTTKTSTESKTLHNGIIYGENGWIEIPEYWKARKAILCMHGMASEFLEYPCEYELVYEINHASECIRKSLTSSPVMTRQMSVRSIEIIDKLRKSFDKNIHEICEMR